LVIFQDQVLFERTPIFLNHQTCSNLLHILPSPTNIVANTNIVEKYCRYFQDTQHPYSFKIFLVQFWWFKRKRIIIKKKKGCYLERVPQPPQAENYENNTICAWPKINWPVIFLFTSKSKVFFYWPKTILFILNYFLKHQICSKILLEILSKTTTPNLLKNLKTI